MTEHALHQAEIGQQAHDAQGEGGQRRQEAHRRPLGRWRAICRRGRWCCQTATTARIPRPVRPGTGQEGGHAHRSIGAAVEKVVVGHHGHEDQHVGHPDPGHGPLDRGGGGIGCWGVLLLLRGDLLLSGPVQPSSCSFSRSRISVRSSLLLPRACRAEVRAASSFFRWRRLSGLHEAEHRKGHDEKVQAWR